MFNNPFCIHLIGEPCYKFPRSVFSCWISAGGKFINQIFRANNWCQLAVLSVAFQLNSNGPSSSQMILMQVCLSASYVGKWVLLLTTQRKFPGKSVLCEHTQKQFCARHKRRTKNTAFVVKYLQRAFFLAYTSPSKYEWWNLQRSRNQRESFCCEQTKCITHMSSKLLIYFMK